jgi:hypothetical protein
MRSARLLAVGFLCFGFTAACASAEALSNVPPDNAGGASFANGGTASGVGGFQAGTGSSDGSGGAGDGNGGGAGTSGSGAGSGRGGDGSGGSSGGGTGGGSDISGGSIGAGGAGCFLGFCLPATGGSGGAVSSPDAGDSHKAMCNQKLCVDPVFDCLLQGCGDAICQIPFCVIK